MGQWPINMLCQRQWPNNATLSGYLSLIWMWTSTNSNRNVNALTDPIKQHPLHSPYIIGWGPASNILILHEARPGMRPQTVHFEKHRSMSTQQIICCVVYFKGVLEVKQINCCVPGGVLYRPNGFAASLGRILQFTLSLFQKTMMCGSWKSWQTSHIAWPGSLLQHRKIPSDCARLSRSGMRLRMTTWMIHHLRLSTMTLSHELEPL